MAEQDPTPTGGQENEQINARQTAEEQIAAKVDSAQSEDLLPLDVDEQGDLHYVRDEKGRFAPKEEAGAEPAPEPVQAGSEPAPAPVEPAPAAAPAAPKMVSIVVDGQSIEIEESRLLEAGKRTLQKESAADRRLQEATQLRKQAEEEFRRIQARASGEPAPSTDAQEQPNPSTISPETLDVLLENKLYNRDAQKAAAKFKQDFPEIAADPHLMNMAASLENQRLATVTALGESYGDPFEAYRKHGEDIQKWMGKFKPVAVTSEDKIERKRTIVAVPAANAKAPAPQDDKPPTIQEIINSERKARQGRPAPQRSH